MIIFTSGFPYSGKTTFIKKLMEELDHKLTIHIDPKKYYEDLDNFSEMPKEEKTAIAITAWEMSLEKVSNCICKLPNKALIIYDTCGSKASYMKPLFVKAKEKGHYVFYIFVHASLEDRKSRSPSIDLDSLEQRYAEDFRNTTKILRKVSDDFMLIHFAKETDQNRANAMVKSFAEKIKNVIKE